MNNIVSSWDKKFLNLAKFISTWSKDPSTKVGAVIANEHHQVLSLGYNGFPRGVEDIESRYNDRDVKLLYVAHAERNALDNAYTDVRGATLYTSLCPCNECAKSIIQRGIKRVVTHPPPIDKVEVFKMHVTTQMFDEASVHLLIV